MAIDASGERLYTIGAFARALGKTSQTIRAWETTGILPVEPLRMNSPSESRRHWRIYPEWFIDLVVRIAQEEGVARRKVADFRGTTFTQRVVEASRAHAMATAKTG